jgi:tRNA threonylcarbamoyladenosine biosynthesis protein TsaE
MITRSKEETQRFGEELAKELSDGGIICLYGEMGSGKTTLTQGISKGLGIKQNIVSPTFILMRRYEAGEKFIYHIDLYRLNDLSEAKGLGIEEILSNPKNIVIIEWPEMAETLIPKKHTKVKIKALSEGEREIEIIH